MTQINTKKLKTRNNRVSNRNGPFNGTSSGDHQLGISLFDVVLALESLDVRRLSVDGFEEVLVVCEVSGFLFDLAVSDLLLLAESGFLPLLLARLEALDGGFSLSFGSSLSIFISGVDDLRGGVSGFLFSFSSSTLLAARSCSLSFNFCSLPALSI